VSPPAKIARGLEDRNTAYKIYGGAGNPFSVGFGDFSIDSKMGVAEISQNIGIFS
jgi:hypothetical protein